MNMSKSETCEYFRHIFANNFFGAFCKNFLTALKSAWNSAFLIPIVNFLAFIGKCAPNVLFYKHVIEFN